MKKKLLLVSALFSLSVATFAQKGIHLGIKGGANINKLSGQSFSDQFSFGYQLGGYAVIGVSKHLSVQPEVLFSQVKADTSTRFNDIYNSLINHGVSDIKLTYLSIPLLLNYSPVKYVSFQAGPQFGILIDQGRNILQNGKDAFKHGDFSMLGGIQFNLANLKVYGRYAVGLSNINDIDNRDKWKNQSIQLGLGVNIF